MRWGDEMKGSTATVFFMMSKYQQIDELDGNARQAGRSTTVYS